MQAVFGRELRQFPVAIGGSLIVPRLEVLCGNRGNRCRIPWTQTAQLVHRRKCRRAVSGEFHGCQLHSCAVDLVELSGVLLRTLQYILSARPVAVRRCRCSPAEPSLREGGICFDRA